MYPQKANSTCVTVIIRKDQGVDQLAVIVIPDETGINGVAVDLETGVDQKIVVERQKDTPVDPVVVIENEGMYHILFQE